MPDKYDEVTRTILDICGVLLPAFLTEKKCNNLLRSAFPPPAEDARQCAENISTDCMKLVNEESCDNYDMEVDIIKAAAEISRFAESRVEPWREALGNLLDAIEDDVAGTPMSKRLASTAAVARQARALLSDSPAKEPAK